MNQAAQLRVYRFGPDMAFEGGLLTAIERLEIDEEGTLLDALLVMRDAATGALQAAGFGATGGDTTLASLLDFRLDPARRAAVTERTLADAVQRPAVESMAATLEPGAAVIAVLYAGPTPAALEEAVARAGGHRVADEPAGARTLAQLGDRLRAAAAS